MVLIALKLELPVQQPSAALKEVFSFIVTNSFLLNNNLHCGLYSTLCDAAEHPLPQEFIKITNIYCFIIVHIFIQQF